MCALARTLQKSIKKIPELAFRASRATDRSRNAFFFELISVKMVPGAPREASRGSAGSSWGALGCLFGLSWVLLGSSWAPLGFQKPHKKSPGLIFLQKNAFGRILSSLCRSRAQLGRLLDPLGRSRASFTAVWGACKALRTHFGPPFRRHSCTISCTHNPQPKSSIPSEPPPSQEFPH